MFQNSDFGHRGEDCTFETLEKEFRIRDRRVGVIGQMVLDADFLDDGIGRTSSVAAGIKAALSHVAIK